ncbi:MAG: L-threonylcarbamoyladenylate synthase [Saprospiraceae bacterium]
MTVLEEALFVASLFKDNKVVLYPTDTIWGIGANIHDLHGIERINDMKSRSSNKSFILLVDSIEMLKKYVIRIHPRIETMLSYHVQPVSIVYPRTTNIPDYLLAPDKSVAIRICNSFFCQEIIKAVGHPIISSSANFGGKKSPSNFSEIDPELIPLVDYVCKFGQDDLSINTPSVLAKYDEDGELIFLR